MLGAGAWCVVGSPVVLELQAHDGFKVLCLDVCTDGTRMASGGEDGTVRVWEVSTGKCLQGLKGHRYEMNNLVCVCVCVFRGGGGVGLLHAHRVDSS